MDILRITVADGINVWVTYISLVVSHVTYIYNISEVITAFHNEVIGWNYLPAYVCALWPFVKEVTCHKRGLSFLTDAETSITLLNSSARAPLRCVH
jgi:hypothetical protein